MGIEGSIVNLVHLGIKMKLSHAHKGRPILASGIIKFSKMAAVTRFRMLPCILRKTNMVLERRFREMY